MRTIALLAAVSLGLASSATAATITVTSTADSGAGTLRQAVLDSNASAGVLDTIEFAIPGGGVHTITITTTFPQASDPLVIDATTQPGYTGSPLVEVTTDNGSQGIRIDAGQSTVRGLAIYGFGTNLAFFTNGGNLVEACFIGIDATGTATSVGSGIYLQNAPDSTVGGMTAAVRNVISGMNGTGITAISAHNAVIRGNLIGTGPSGDTDLGNVTGISLVNSNDVVVGGTVAGMGNLISGNSIDGVAVNGGSGVLIAGNLIGTDITGTQPLLNVFGIDAVNLTGPITIGGTTAAARNVISGNNVGVILNNGVGGAKIQNNYFGTDITGTLPLPNVEAILLNTITTTDVLIGGVGPGEGNLIAFNAGAGYTGAIWNFGLRVTVRGNTIYSNFGLGFDNDNTGVNPNDPGDADAGANDGQNFPIVSTVEALQGPQGAGTRVTGVLRSEPNTQYTLDFYGNTACTPRPQDFLEGQVWLGSALATTDGTGFVAFDSTVPVAIAPGDFVSATATDPDGSTSEFSQRLPFSILPASGDATGGAPITIQGTDFAAGAIVTIGGQPATNVNVVGPTQITATTPALAAGTVSDLTVTNTDSTAGTLPKAWVADFLDVPNFHIFNSFVAALVRNAITAGIGSGLYGVAQPTLRQQMAVFILKGKYGVCYVPPPCTGTFDDVPCPSTFAAWIEDLADQGITGGCGTDVYCPQNPVRRDQMAVFLLKAKYGSGHVPPPCAGDFSDVTCPGAFAVDWIEQLADEQITGGCDTNPPRYCPLNNNTRGQMAVFLTKTFLLQ